MKTVLTAIAHVHVFPQTLRLWGYKTMTWWEHVKQAYHYYKILRALYHAHVKEEEAKQ